MTFQTLGKNGNPAVLLLGGAGVDHAALGALLRPLADEYQLLIPPADAAPEALETALRADYAGRIWGAYALREGGETLLALLGRGTVRIRTAVLDGTRPSALPRDLASAPTQLIYWVGSRDGAGKKCRQALRAAVPALKTVTLQKLRGDQLFIFQRADLLIRRLRRSFGKAKTVSLASLMPAGAARIWRLLPRQDAERFLTERDEPVADEKNRVYITGGRGKLIRLWSHLTRLEGLSDDATIYTDQVELAAGPLSPVVGLWVRRYLRRGQRRCRRALRRNTTS